MPDPEIYQDPNRLGTPDAESKILLHQYDRAKQVRDDWQQKRKEWFRAYMSYAKPKKTVKTGANLFMPMIYTAVESFIPRLVANRPRIEVWPRDPDDAVRAAMHRALLLRAWDQMDMPVKLVNFVKSALIFGISWMKVVHRREQRLRRVREIEEVPRFGGFFGGFPGNILPLPPEKRLVTVDRMVDVYNGPFATLLDLDEVLPDPDGEDEETCSYIIHEVPKVSLSELQNAKTPDGRPLYKEGVLRQLVEMAQANPLDLRDQETLRQDRREIFGSGAEPEIDPHKIQFTPLERWTDEKVTVVLKEFPQLPPIRHDVNEYGMKPFVRYTPIPIPKTLEGVSTPQVGWSINLEENALHNARMDSLMMAVHQFYLILRGSGINPRTLNVRPRGWAFTNRLDGMKPLETKPLEFALYRESDYLSRWMQDATGSTDTFRGMASQLTGGTATEASLLATASASRAGLMFQMLGDQALKRFGRLVIRIHELYAEEMSPVRITGEDLELDETSQAELVQEMPNGERFLRVDPERLLSKGGLELDLVISIAETEPETRQFRLRRAIEGLQVASQILPPHHPIIELLLMQLAEGLGENRPQALIEHGRLVAEAYAAAQQAPAAGTNNQETLAQDLSADNAEGGTDGRLRLNVGAQLAQ